MASTIDGKKDWQALNQNKAASVKMHETYVKGQKSGTEEQKNAGERRTLGEKLRAKIQTDAPKNTSAPKVKNSSGPAKEQSQVTGEKSTAKARETAEKGYQEASQAHKNFTKNLVEGRRAPARDASSSEPAKNNNVNKNQTTLKTNHATAQAEVRDPKKVATAEQYRAAPNANKAQKKNASDKAQETGQKHKALAEDSKEKQKVDSAKQGGTETHQDADAQKNSAAHAGTIAGSKLDKTKGEEGASSGRSKVGKKGSSQSKTGMIATDEEAVVEKEVSKDLGSLIGGKYGSMEDQEIGADSIEPVVTAAPELTSEEEINSDEVKILDVKGQEKFDHVRNMAMHCKKTVIQELADRVEHENWSANPLPLSQRIRTAAETTESVIGEANLFLDLFAKMNCPSGPYGTGSSC